MSVRLAHVGDARAIATVHVRAWQDAYRGLVPDGYLDGLSIEERQRFWDEVLQHDPVAWRQASWVSERNGEVVGFVTAGRSRDDDADRDRDGEIQAIYVLAEARGSGVGRRLQEEALAWLRDEGFERATLWVLEGNAIGRGFYEATGWVPDGASKREVWDHVEMDEVRYQRVLS